MRAVTDLQPLRAFVAVARSGSVSRAATGLNLSQPAVSLQLRALAEQTGLALFERRGRGLHPTGDGMRLLAHAERVLADLSLFNGAVGSLHRTVRGRLRLGTILDPAFLRLGEVLKRLTDDAPQLDVDLSHAISGTVLTRLQDQSLDAGWFLGTDLPESRPGIVLRPLHRFDYRVVAPRGWEDRLADRDWAALAGLPWITTPPESVHHRLLAQVYGPGSSTGLVPRSVARVDQEASMIDLVQAGIGLSLMRDSIALRESQTRGLVVSDRVRLRCRLSFVHLEARRGEPAIDAACRAVDHVWPDRNAT